MIANEFNALLFAKMDDLERLDYLQYCMGPQHIVRLEPYYIMDNRLTAFLVVNLDLIIFDCYQPDSIYLKTFTKTDYRLLNEYFENLKLEKP